MTQPNRRELEQGTWREVFATFLKLGLTSFGGPIAHLGYFHRELVQKRRWIDDPHYAQLLGLCQFLPGPASSQLGFSLGLLRAGWLGGIAAFIAFTLPSALLLFLFAQLMPSLGHPVSQAAIHGLKLLAVAVVAQGVLTMAERLTPDTLRRIVALIAATVMITTDAAATQLALILAGAIVGSLLCRSSGAGELAGLAPRYGARTSTVLFGAFIVLLAASFLPLCGITLRSVSAAFYRAGALVFGGGHVVLPLLQQSVVTPGWVDGGDFLAGYGAAQAVPGPMFSFAAFLGARVHEIGGVTVAIVSTIAIFLPGLLLVSGSLPFWHGMSRGNLAAGAIAGVNAVVVGILAAALYNPVWISAVHGWIDVVIAVCGFLLLSRLPVLAVVAFCVLASVGSYAVFQT
ncbi:MAG TPA: chromate efflux transporter [Steroidobacteraceae bacterium]|nr:chromate efflux transporter [Steroidobacteraceae bacterium]